MTASFSPAKQMPVRPTIPGETGHVATHQGIHDAIVELRTGLSQGLADAASDMDARYKKPSGGIPLADLAPDAKIATWSQVPKPPGGIPAADLDTTDLVATDRNVARLPLDGTTDIGAAIQTAYDSGAQVIRLLPNITYLWDTPVFLDRPDALTGLTIEGNKARVKLGPNLPTSNWSADATCKFAIFPNTKRTALSGGVVTVSDANRATGTVGALRTLIVRDLTVDGQGSDPRGFSFANRTPVSFEHVTGYQVRVASTWWSYGDASHFTHCYMRRGTGPTGAAFVEQTSQGDGLTFVGCKQDGDIFFAKLRENHGASFIATLGKVSLTDCTAVTFSGFHNEGQQSGTTLVQLFRSQVTFTGACFYETWTNSAAAITIDDSGQTQIGSELILDNCASRQLFNGSDTANIAFSPVVDILGSTDNTRVVVKNFQGLQGSSTIPWRATNQGLIRSATTAIQTAIDSIRGRTAIASGTWNLSKTGSTWTFGTGLGAGVFTSQRQTANPTISQIATTALTAGSGTLTSGSVYEFAVAVLDGLGNYSQASAAVSATAGANGVLQILTTIATPPGVLVIWRKAGTGVLGAPDAYAVLPVRGARVYLFDTGNYVGGRPWITTNVPVPNTVAAANNTVTKVIADGAALPVAADVAAVASTAADATTAANNATTAASNATTAANNATTAANAAASAAAPGLDFDVALYGVSLFTVRPDLATTATALTSGTMAVHKVRAGASGTPTLAAFYVGAAGSASTLMKVAVYDAAGALIGSGSDPAQGNSSGQRTLTMTFTRALTQGEVLYVAILWIGGGSLTLLGSVSASALNIGLSAAQGSSMFRSSAVASLTDIPSTLPFTSATSATQSRLIVLK